MSNKSLALSDRTPEKTRVNSKAYCHYEEFIKRLNPYRASDYVDAEGSVTWVFASECCMFEVQFNAEPVVQVRWRLAPEAAADVPAESSLAVEVGRARGLGELVALVVPVHEAIAQERANDVARKGLVRSLSLVPA